MVFSILATAVNSIFPIVTIILLGCWLKRIGFLSEAFLANGNKLVFRLLLPVMLFYNVYKTESTDAIPWGLVLYCVLALLLLFLLGMATVGLFTRDPRQKGVILQTVFRSNTSVIGIALAEALGGSAAVAVSAILTAFTVPVLNVLAVIALTMYIGGDARKPTARDTFLRIVRNPMIDGILLGMLCVAIRTAQQALFGQVVFSIRRNVPFLYTAISQIAAITSPLALLILGGQFNFTASGKMLRQIAGGTLWRIAAAPLLGIGGAYLLTRAGVLSCGQLDYPGLIAVFGTPAAVSCPIMAAEMKNDSQLAAQLVVWTHIGSILTIFITVCILMSAGLLAV